MAVGGAEGGADDAVADGGDHGAHFVAADHPRANAAAFVVHARDDGGALLEFGVRQAEREAAVLAQRDAAAEGFGQLRPDFGRAARPVGVGGVAEAFALHPDQAEIAAGGAVGDVPLVDQGDARTLPGGAPGDGGADQAAADHDQIIGAHRGRSGLGQSSWSPARGRIIVAFPGEC